MTPRVHVKGQKRNIKVEKKMENKRNKKDSSSHAFKIKIVFLEGNAVLKSRLKRFDKKHWA